MRTYEEKLNADLNWALQEGGLHFQENNQVHKTLQRVAGRLRDLGIPYAVVGGMAMFAHGFRRFTEDVDLLVTDESMRRIHEALEGLGYLAPAGTTTKLRDTETGVRIEFLITGRYPGDGKPKSVQFPDPADAAIEIDGISYLNLPKLIELKLASGMTGGVHRLKDVADVVELIRTLSLPADLANQLDPLVRQKYLDLWNELRVPAPEP